MDKSFLILLALGVVAVAARSAGAIGWEWNTPGDTEGWTAGNAVSSVASSGGELVATYDGAINPWIWSPPNLGLDASEETVLVINLEMIDPGIGTVPQFLFIFYRRQGFPQDDWGAHAFFFTIMPNVGKKTYVVHIPDRLATQDKPAHWSGTIDQLRFDLGISTYTTGATCRIDAIQIVPFEEDLAFEIDLNDTEGVFKQPFNSLNYFYPAAVPGNLKETQPFVENVYFFNAFGSNPSYPEYEIYDEDADTVYQFHKLTDNVDTIVAAGLTPYLTLGSCPVDLARNPGAVSPVYGTMTCGPSDYGTYRTFVKDLFEFMDARYGEETVASWLYRFMTEPDNPEWWTDSREEWFKFYDYTVSAAYEANPGVRICPGNLAGHPTEYPQSWVVPLAEFLESGVFLVPGEDRPYIPPRLTFSVYAPYWINEGRSPRMLDSDVTIRDALEPFPSFDGIALGIDEGFVLGDENHRVIWARIDGTEWGAAHFALLCQTMMDGMWTVGTLFEAGNPECPPPMRNVLNLVHGMNGMTKLAVPEPTRLAAPGNYASVLAAKSVECVTIMLANYHYNRTASDALDAQVVLTNLPPGHYEVSHKRVDHGHGNYSAQWLIDSASIDRSDISEYELDPLLHWWNEDAQALWDDNYATYQALARDMDMDSTTHVVDSSGELTLSVRMPAHSVSFLYIESPDVDGDGLSNEQETMDLDPYTPGIQNPFDPNVEDSTGNNGSTEPDGISDDRNDWDGDGMSNADEFTWGYNPIDPESYGELPATTPLGLLLLMVLVILAGWWSTRKNPRQSALVAVVMLVMCAGASVASPLDITEREDLVSIGYSTWFNLIDNYPTFNITEILEANPEDPQWGCEYCFHYFAEPALGYYTSDDKSVIREHMHLLEEAGIDFIIADNTNMMSTWDETQISSIEEGFDALLDTMLAMRGEGAETPHLIFWSGSWNGYFAGVVDPDPAYAGRRVYQRYYQSGIYDDLFVYYRGKPLTCLTDAVPSELMEYFTVRKMWAWQQSDTEEVWSTRQHYPQIVAYSLGEPEQIGVSTAYGFTYINLPDAVTRRGGRTFSEQWSTAFDVRPKIVTVAWWNSWATQRFIISGQTRFVDTYTVEASEDIEPMKAFQYLEPDSFRGGVFDPDVLRLARLRRGLHPEWAAAQMGLSRFRLLQLEAGAQPTPSEFEAVEKWLTYAIDSYGDTYYKLLKQYIEVYKTHKPFPQNLIVPYPTTAPQDNDSDGTPDYSDPDDDEDGFTDVFEGTGDADGDGIPNYLDQDSNGDGIPDSAQGANDVDQDGTLDFLELDIDGDGLANSCETQDLDPLVPGIQNPFDPNVEDSTGNNGSTEPDGISDGRNDWDGDGMSNADEFTWGYNPIDPESYGELPATTPLGLLLAMLLLLACGTLIRRESVRTCHTRQDSAERP